MLSVEEAFQRIMASFSQLESEEVPLLDCLGQVLAEDIQSPLDLPPLSNSAMDGYAVLSTDIQGASKESPRNLEVIGLVAAGQVSTQTVISGTAIRIMTGAPVPAGADAVVPFEETDEVERRDAGRPLDQVAIFASLSVGVNVRPAGEDVRQGQQVLDAGTPVRPSEIGVMASLGLTTARVIRRPVVAILATGDELVASGRPLEEGMIFDSNSFSVAGSVIACGGIPRILGIARDNLDDLNSKLTEAAGSDMIVTSAGVSKGDYDIVKDVLTERGDMNFWSVRMRPAKPLAFGHLREEGGRSVPLLGLPGNPVSTMVAFEMFARPAIQIMLGKRRLARPMVDGVLTAPIYNTDGRRVYARVEVTRKDGIYFANPVGPQGSNILTSMSRANGLAICPDDLPSKAAGEQVQIIMLDWNEEVDL
jgi:molybdopterin molybdotransferase